MEKLHKAALSILSTPRESDRNQWKHSQRPLSHLPNAPQNGCQLWKSDQAGKIPLGEVKLKSTFYYDHQWEKYSPHPIATNYKIHVFLPFSCRFPLFYFVIILCGAFKLEKRHLIKIAPDAIRWHQLVVGFSVVVLIKNIDSAASVFSAHDWENICRFLEMT